MVKKMIFQGFLTRQYLYMKRPDFTLVARNGLVAVGNILIRADTE